HKVVWIRDVDPQQVPPAPAGWNLHCLTSEQVLSGLPAGSHAIVLDFPMKERTGAELVEAVRRFSPDLPILIRDPEATPTYAVRMSHLGATQFLPSQGDPFPLIEEVITESTLQCVDSEPHPWQRFLIGNSSQMRRISQIIKLVGGK